MHILRRSTQILEKLSSFMTASYNVTLKLESSWAKKVVKPILETWNASDVVLYGLFILG